jgi:hypothetical protein
MIKRRIKSVTAPPRKRSLLTLSPAKRKAKLKAKQHYQKNKAKILKAAKERRKKLTPAEKEFNRKRAAHLRKLRANSPTARLKKVVKHTVRKIRSFI